ncbi:MAG: class I SAM-dependent methyltransferase [Treponema sp.]|jgi:ubiquinone/menaquinone biosynthesis C-methylase UbiE|nr:class I SAM-dependent methyltransferase [Treponema sp.]
MFNRFLQNMRKPQGAGGWFLISTMNWGHGPISRWGLKNLVIKPGDHILDIGCGGGKNVARMLKRAGEGKVCGLDYSEVCVEKTKRLNRKAVRGGRADIRLGSVSENPWPDNSFDVATAFETVYFWPDFVNDLREVRRVLKPGGVFFICNEMNKPEEGEAPYQFWIKKLNMNTYTQSEFQKHLTDAGFTDMQFISRGKSAFCARARAKKE